MIEIPASFNEAKTAQMAAYLLLKRGGRMSHMKLIKLLYMADRESCDRSGFPMSGDTMVSLKYGPVLSSTLNILNGEPSSSGEWSHFISQKQDHQVGLVKSVQEDDLDELSVADKEILDFIWDKFGSMTRWDLVKYTHDENNCPEWEDPKESSKPIEVVKLFEALGNTKAEAKKKAQAIEEQSALEEMFYESRKSIEIRNMFERIDL